MAAPRIIKLLAAVNVGSYRTAAMVAGVGEDGSLIVLGSGHRASEGIRRGYVVDMERATHAIRDALERAEKMAGHRVDSVWVGCSGAGLASTEERVTIDIGGRRVEQDDIDHLLIAGRDVIEPDGRMVLHAHPAHYTLDGQEGVSSPKGLHAETLAVDIHVVLADGAPIRNITEAVHNAHLGVNAVVGSPIASGHACLTREERELGVALIEFGGDVTNVSLHAAGMLAGLFTIPFGSNDITDAVASGFGIKRYQAERLKCVAGSAISSPADHREMVPVLGPNETLDGQPLARFADEHNRIPRAELISVIAQQLDGLMATIGQELKVRGFTGRRGQQVVLTGGGAQLAGLADYCQQALGRSVRIGKPPALKGLAEAHATPGFSTLAGLIVYAAADPVDIRTIQPAYQTEQTYKGKALFKRVSEALREYF